MAPLTTLSDPKGRYLSGNNRRLLAETLFGDLCAGSVAERVGFEPTVPLPARRISSAVHSTTLSPLRETKRHRRKASPSLGRRGL